MQAALDWSLQISIVFVPLFLPVSLQFVLYTLQFSKNFYIALFDSHNNTVKQ